MNYTEALKFLRDYKAAVDSLVELLDLNTQECRTLLHARVPGLENKLIAARKVAQDWLDQV